MQLLSEMGMGIGMGMEVMGKNGIGNEVLEWEWVRMGMIRWEWEGNGNKKVIPAHLYLKSDHVGFEIFVARCVGFEETFCTNV